MIVSFYITPQSTKKSNPYCENCCFYIWHDRRGGAKKNADSDQGVRGQGPSSRPCRCQAIGRAACGNPGVCKLFPAEIAMDRSLTKEGATETEIILQPQCSCGISAPAKTRCAPVCCQSYQLDRPGCPTHFRHRDSAGAPLEYSPDRFPCWCPEPLPQNALSDGMPMVL